jgi:hypothetical protein
MDTVMMSANCRICLLSETNCKTCNLKEYKAMNKMTLLEYAKAANPKAPAIWLTNGELVDILVELADLHCAMEIMRGEAEPHPIEEAVAIERVIDAVLNTAENVVVRPNPQLVASVRYCSELDERKAQADAICEEYEAQDADWRAQVTELRGGI